MKHPKLAAAGVSGNLSNSLKILTKAPSGRYAWRAMTTPPETPTPALRRALHRLAASVTLSQDETRLAFEEIMSGMADPAAIGALLLAMRTRGETPAEVAGAVIALRQVMRRVAHPVPDRLVDTCGTGGGIVGTLNISTAAAFVAAGAGVPIAKHGNRSFTSKSGSADVLEALDIAIDLSPEAATRQLTGEGLAFLFAPLYHPAMRHVAPIRRALGVPTMMNLLGPLANPAGARRQVVGVADAARAELIAEALARLGTIHALVVHADVGMDEIAPIGTTSVREIRGSEIVRWTLDPADYGFSITSLDGLEGGEPAENAARIEALLRAPESAPPAVRAAVLLNAAAAIHVGDDGGDFAKAVSRATEALINGSAAGRLEALRSRSA
jgi:anthranilate phosphoribosyltransferase